MQVKAMKDMCIGIIRVLFWLAGILMLCFAVFPQAASCAGECTEMGITVFDPGPDGGIMAEITINGSGALPAAGELELTYNPEAFTAREVLKGELLHDIALFGSNMEEPGIIRASWADPMAANGRGTSGVLLRLAFQGDKGLPLLLNFTKVELVRMDGRRIPYRIKGKGLEIKDCRVNTGEIHLQIGSAEAFVDGARAILSAAPFLQEGRTMVPLRFVGENFGAEVSWLPEINQVDIEDGGQSIRLIIDSPLALVNGAEKGLDAAAVIKNGVTFVPLRFVSDILGAGLAWDGANQKIVMAR